MIRLLHVLLAAWLLLALPLAQHDALLHALGHAAAQDEGGAPAPDQCPDHSLYVPFAGAVGSASWHAPPIAAADDAAGLRDAPVARAAATAAYLSRAPPAPPAIA